MGICYVIGAGDCRSIDFNKNTDDFVICADGGLKYAENYGIVPDMIVGDFDSYGCTPGYGNIIVLPREKDVTDTFYAVKLGLEKGYKSFCLYGMLGGRIDHTIANIQLLVYLSDKNCEAVLCGDDYNVFALKNSNCCLKGSEGKYVSVFAYSSVCKGVSVKGLKYEVENFVLCNNNPLGVSNEFTEKNAFIEVKDGTLIIAVQK